MLFIRGFYYTIIKVSFYFGCRSIDRSKNRFVFFVVFVKKAYYYYYYYYRYYSKAPTPSNMHR